MSTPMRMATATLPKVWLLDPSGYPVHLSHTSNINNGVTYEMQGSILLQPKAAAKGWRFMKDKCTPEEWSDWSEWSEKADAVKGRMDPPPMSERPACIRTGPPAPEPPKKKAPKSDPWAKAVETA